MSDLTQLHNVITYDMVLLSIDQLLCVDAKRQMIRSESVRA